MIVWIKISFFCLIPIGIYGFVRVHRLYKKIFKNEIVVEFFLDNTEIDFELPSTGYYSIWQKGEFFKRSFVDKYKLQLINLDSNIAVRLYGSLMRPNSNNMKTAEMELFWFKSSVGTYKLSLINGGSITRAESLLTNPLVLNNSRSSRSKSSIQVRKSAFPGASLIFILLILFSFFCVLGGFVFGLLADRIFV